MRKARPSTNARATFFHPLPAPMTTWKPGDRLIHRYNPELGTGRIRAVEGRTVVVVTHDVELVAQCAERVILMGDGDIVVDGPVREVMNDSQVFGSQINKLFRDPRFLTVEDVVEALAI